MWIATARRARALASEIRMSRGFALQGVTVCLGRLESGDFAPLSPQRKEAVQAFWAEYLKDRGQAPTLRFDGVGSLSASTVARNQKRCCARNPQHFAHLRINGTRS